MAVAVDGKKQPRASAPWLSFNYVACKLTMSRRTPRIKINTTALGDERFTTELDRVDYHQLCASFLKDFLTRRSVTRCPIFRQVIVSR